MHVTTTFSLKQGETRRNSVPIPHPLMTFLFINLTSVFLEMKVRFPVENKPCNEPNQQDVRTVILYWVEKQWHASVERHAVNY